MKKLLPLLALILALGSPVIISSALAQSTATVTFPSITVQPPTVKIQPPSITVTPPAINYKPPVVTYQPPPLNITVDSSGNITTSYGTVVTTTPPPPPPVVTGSCGYTGSSSDGCTGATPIAPQYPSLLSSYSRRPNWNVAGVDYAVGPSGTLKDVTTSVPTGCSLSGSTLSCSGNVTISGYDLTGKRIYVGSGTAVITNNKFTLAPGCADPIIDLRGQTGSVLISKNSFDGGGATCTNLNFGTLINTSMTNGSTLTITYNLFTNVPQDAIDANGPSSGAANFVAKYNVFYNQGWTGHPDGFQFNGGNFSPIDIGFNTYYTIAPPTTNAGTQPFHVESQLTAALSNITVHNNTLLTLSGTGTSCNGGSIFPKNCSVNYVIACKQDSGVNSTTNFYAYGNWIDASGAIRALTNAYGCPSAYWNVDPSGASNPNIDLPTGVILTP